MPVQIPQVGWPAELSEEGPAEDPFILLTGAAMIGRAPCRVLAIRVSTATLAIDYRPDLEEEIYADLQLEEMLSELTFAEDIDRSVLVPMETGNYVVWMIPHGTSPRN